MAGLISIAGVCGILLATGALFGLLDRRNFSLGWLAAAAGLVLLNDALLTNAYGLVPEFLSSLKWNWQGKATALMATLVLARSDSFGWRKIGLVLRQKPGSLRSSVMMCATYCALFVALALALPSTPASGETVAFQLTMPGLEEETFYRGLLLATLDRAFSGRVRMLGVDWGWGAVLSCLLFGLAHAFGYSDGSFTFDPMTMALTAVPASLAVWLRYRTGSLLLPIFLHNAGNAMSFLI